MKSQKEIATSEKSAVCCQILTFQLENIEDLRKCCKTRTTSIWYNFLAKSVPIQPKASQLLPTFWQTSEKKSACWASGGCRGRPLTGSLRGSHWTNRPERGRGENSALHYVENIFAPCQDMLSVWRAARGTPNIVQFVSFATGNMQRDWWNPIARHDERIDYRWRIRALCQNEIAGDY